MTLNELIAEAKKIKGWRLEGEAIRCKRGDCPILAVLRRTSPGTFDDNPVLDNGNYSDAAEILGLRKSVAHKIVAAADAEPIEGLWSRDLTRSELSLRSRLIEELIPKSRRPKASLTLTRHHAIFLVSPVRGLPRK